MKATITREMINRLIMKSDMIPFEDITGKWDREISKLEEKATMFDEKENPFIITDSDRIFGTCKCNYVVSYPQIYCHNCGQRLEFKRGE